MAGSKSRSPSSVREFVSKECSVGKKAAIATESNHPLAGLETKAWVVTSLLRFGQELPSVVTHGISRRRH